MTAAGQTYNGSITVREDPMLREIK
jgi:hypothetical protein